MNTTSNGVYRPAQQLYPAHLLAQLAAQAVDGCLKIASGSSAWLLHLEQGNLVYASDLIDPFGRLDHHLRLMHTEATHLVSAVRVQVRLMFETPTVDQPAHHSDYQAICWLVEQQHLTTGQAAVLVEAMSKEVLESCLPIQTGSYELVPHNLLAEFPKFCRLQVKTLAEECQMQMRHKPFEFSSILTDISTITDSKIDSKINSRIDSTTDQIVEQSLSSFVNRKVDQVITQNTYKNDYDSEHEIDRIEKIQRRIFPERYRPAGIATEVEKSKNFRLAGRDLEINDLMLSSEQSNVANSSLIQTDLWPVQPSALSNTQLNTLSNHQPYPNSSPQTYPSYQFSKPQSSTDSQTYTIACINDNPAVLKIINNFLDEQRFSVVSISDSVKALIQIMCISPDLILLDVTMPGLDGYELCSLLRKHRKFRATPVIIVSSSIGLIDRAKAKLVGSAGYLTKPFTQSELLKIMLRHLS
jgi:two-component system, chemotaxis family, response regulator PixG